MPKSAIKELDLSILVEQIRHDHPDVSFVEGAHFSWHAGKRHVSFKRSSASAPTKHDIWSLLHELGHALLEHTDYRYDVELLKFESAAWEKARELAHDYCLEINEDYLQDCLDTYRDWLHLRATCPTCSSRSFQASPRRYHCFNCQTEWNVTRSRLCRPYRLQTA